MLMVRLIGARSFPLSFFFCHPGPSCADRGFIKDWHRANGLAVRMILPAWFYCLEESFCC